MSEARNHTTFRVERTYIDLFHPFETHEVFAAFHRAALFACRLALCDGPFRLRDLRVEQGYVGQPLPSLFIL